MAGIGDFVSDIGGGIVRGAGEVVEGAGRVVREVAGVFDIGESSGNDHGSSNWAAWGHHEIRSMLDNTVDEGDIQEAAQAWRVQREKDVEIIASLTRDLNGIISNGWGGLSGEKAMGALDPVNQWSATFAEAARLTGELMEHSGSSAGQAKAAVPPAVDHDIRQTFANFVKGGVPRAFSDAIAQDHAQEEARREAVRIMNNVYSAPINENRAEVPSYPQPVDPTLQTPEPSPVGGPSPGAGLPWSGSGIPGGGGGVPGGGAPFQPPAAAGLQGAGSVDGGQFGSPAGPPQTGGQGYGGAGYPGHGGQSQGLGAAAAVPFMPPMAGGGEQERARHGFRGAGPPGGRPGGGYPGGGRGGMGGYPGGGDFGPRGSNPGPAAAGEGRAGPGAGGVAGGRGGGVPGGVPVGGAGGRGQGGEDTEHLRPSFLIEMNDIFNDGRKVAPPVIGVDLPEDHR
ncbi:MAG: hypothetical protein ACT4NY_15040 [Pseudonocardiales bacterium]